MKPVTKLSTDQLKNHIKKSRLDRVKSIRMPFVFGQAPKRIIKDGEILAVCDKCLRIILIAKQDVYSNHGHPDSPDYGKAFPLHPLCRHDDRIGKDVTAYISFRACMCLQKNPDGYKLIGKFLRDAIYEKTPKYEFSMHGKRRVYPCPA